MRCPSLRWSIALLLVATLLASCGDDGSVAEDRPFKVGTRTATFVDESRTTPATSELPEKPSRTLVTNLWYPAEGEPSSDDTADAPPADGPFPLVVFSHGQSGEPGDYAPLFHRWAEAGYVVAAPRHPVTVRGTPGGPAVGDILNQPGDLSFVITRMGEEHGDLVDLEDVAVAGHSSGAVVALAAGYNTCCHDDRVDAVVLMSVRQIPFDGEYFAEDLPRTPVLFFHGTEDPYFLLSEGQSVFADTPAPKFFVTIQGGDHSRPYRSGPPDPRMVAEASIAFLDRYLLGEDDGLDELEQTVSEYDFAELEAVPE